MGLKINLRILFLTGLLAGHLLGAWSNSSGHSSVDDPSSSFGGPEGYRKKTITGRHQSMRRRSRRQSGNTDDQDGDASGGDKEPDSGEKDGDGSYHRGTTTLKGQGKKALTTQKDVGTTQKVTTQKASDSAKESSTKVHNTATPEVPNADERKQCPDCSNPPCPSPQTGRIDPGVAVGLVLAGVIIGVLMTLLCCSIWSRHRKTSHLGNISRRQGDTSSPTAMENPLSSHLGVQGQYSVATGSRDSHMYSELSVYNEPCMSRGQSRDEYDHTSHITPRPPPDPTYNRTNTPLADQGRQPVGGTRGNMAVPARPADNGLSDRNISPDNAAVSGVIASKHDYFVLEKADKDARNTMYNGTERGGPVEEDDGTAEHDYFVLEKAAKDARDTMDNGTERNGPVEDDGADDVAAQHDYLILEPGANLAGKDTCNTMDSGTGRGGPMREDEADDSAVQHDYFVLEPGAKMSDKDAIGTMVNGTERGGAMEGDDSDDDATQHEYFVLESEAKKDGID